VIYYIIPVFCRRNTIYFTVISDSITTWKLALSKITIDPTCGRHQLLYTKTVGFWYLVFCRRNTIYFTVISDRFYITGVLSNWMQEWKDFLGTVNVNFNMLVFFACCNPMTRQNCLYPKKKFQEIW
jgi:hypothetical protein